jgi:RNA polymerase sigma-70 factor (ECF subfamily)
LKSSLLFSTLHIVKIGPFVAVLNGLSLSDSVSVQNVGGSFVKSLEQRVFRANRLFFEGLDPSHRYHYLRGFLSTHAPFISTSFMRRSLLAVAWSDADLVHETLAGDRDAFGKLVDRHRRTIYALCVQRGLQSEEAEDAAQEVFIKAFKSLSTLQKPEQFARWLYGIAAHVAADTARSRRRKHDEVRLDSAPEVAAEGYRPDGMAQEQVNVLRALSELPEDQRIVLTLRYLEGLTPKDIAERLGEPRGTIRSRLHHALGFLQSAFGVALKKD